MRLKSCGDPTGSDRDSASLGSKTLLEFMLIPHDWFLLSKGIAKGLFTADIWKTR